MTTKDILAATISAPLLVLTPIFETQGTSTTQSWEERFRSEAPTKWQEYGDFVERLQGRMVHKVTTNGEVVIHYQHEFKHNSRCRAIIGQTLMADNAECAAWVHNSSYMFRVWRKSSGHAWAYLDAEQIKDGSSTVRDKTRTGLHNLRLLIEPYHAYPLSDLVRRPEFRIIHVGAQLQAGRELVTIEFDNNHDVDPNNFCPIQSGTMVLDPNHHWCLHSWEFRVKHPEEAAGRVTGHAEVELTDGYAIPKRVVEKHEGESRFVANRRYHNIFERNYQLVVPREFPPDEDFTLAAFGLPEPFELQQQAKVKPNYWLWLALVGGACILIGAASRWWVRRGAA